MKGKSIKSRLIVLPVVIALLLCIVTTKTYSNVVEDEIKRVAQIAAESFSYYKSIDRNARNFYKGQNEIEGQCGDYALRFVVLWNELYPDNPAELVAVNQGNAAQSGSYEVVRTRPEYNPSWWDIPVSGFARYIWNGQEVFGIYHPEVGFYELRLSKAYTVTRHFGVDMTDKSQVHVWAKVGDIAVDPTWADTGNTSFIGTNVATRSDEIRRLLEQLEQMK